MRVYSSSSRFFSSQSCRYDLLHYVPGAEDMKATTRQAIAIKRKSLEAFILDAVFVTRWAHLESFKPTESVQHLQEG